MNHLLYRLLQGLATACVFGLVAGFSGQAPAKEGPEPLAPLTPPRRDFWVGTLTITKKTDITHHRHGPGGLAHAMAKGEGRFTGDDEHHALYTATVTGEPCSDPSVCLSRSSAVVHHSVKIKNSNAMTQPVLCRGGKGAVVLDTEDYKKTEAADGPVTATFSAFLHTGDKTWHIEVNVSGNNLDCKAVTEKATTFDQGCGNTPVNSPPKPKTEVCNVGGFSENFSTGITDPDVRKLDGTLPLLSSNLPDDGRDGNIIRTGTVGKEITITYHLRRVLEY